MIAFFDTILTALESDKVNFEALEGVLKHLEKDKPKA